jgi:hypothetical protein
MSVETSIAQGATGALTAADVLAPMALAETAAAALMEIPAAGLCLVQMIDGAALPGGLGSAAVKWAEAGEKLDEAKQKLKDVTDAIPSDAWTSDDREAFNKKIDELGTQLETARVFADAVGIALITTGTILAAYGVFIAVIGTELLVQAFAILALEASLVGDFGPAEAAIAEANATAAELATNIEETNDTMKTVSKVIAGVLAAAEVIHELVQLGEGNHNVGWDALKGSAVALPEVGLSFLLGKGAEKGAGKLLGKVVGKDLGEEAEGAAKEAADALEKSGAAKEAADAAKTLAGKATDRAAEDVASHSPHAVTQILGAASLTEAAGEASHVADKAASEAAEKAAAATQKGIDAVGHNLFKAGAERAGDYGGQHTGEAGGHLIDKILNPEGE